jgi:hypothetical protein
MAPTVSTEYIYHCKTETSCGVVVEQRRTEGELYWDLGMVVGYTLVFAIIYFLVWIVKFLLQMVVAKKAFRILSVKGFVLAFFLDLS